MHLVHSTGKPLRPKIAIAGTGGHARVVLDIANNLNYEVVGFTSISGETTFCGHTVMGPDEVLARLAEEGTIDGVAIGVGGYRDNERRKTVFDKIAALGVEILTMVHPAAIVSHTASVGRGSVLFAGSIVGPSVEVGDNVIVASGSLIEHDSIVEDHVLISAGVTVGANVVIREGALIALGAKVISHISIAPHALIGAGAVVVNDCALSGLYLGVPANLIEKS